MAASLPANTTSYSSSSEDSEEDSSHPRPKNPLVVGNREPSTEPPPAPPKPGTRRARKPKKQRAFTSKSRVRARSSTDSSSSSEVGSLVDDAGQPRLDHDSESEDLEMSDYPHTGDEGEAWAPSPDRRKRGKRRRRGGLNLRGGERSLGLGDRLVMADGERPVISDEEKKLADGKVIKDMSINALFIGLWYLFSLLISIYNKWMFSPDYLDFHFPLFTTCLHMIVQFCLASLVLLIFPHFRPIGFFGKTSIDQRPSEGGRLSMNSRGEEQRRQKAGIMTLWFYITRVGPCGAATGLDIGLGNMSLKFITLAFYTMCKSSVLGFVLLFAVIFRLEKLTWKLVGVITVMTIGVLMMVASEAHFVPIGFFLVILASALSGLRWSLTQILLLRNPATSNPFSSIFFLAPMMFASILLIAVPVEGFGPLSVKLQELVAQEGLLKGCGILVFPGVIAFLMVSSEFALLKRTSVVTLSICGIFKEVMTISVAAIVFKDPLTPVNISGLFVTITAIAVYNYMKITKMREEARGEAAAIGGPSVSAYIPVEEDEDDDAVSTSYDPDLEGDSVVGTPALIRGENEGDRLI